MISQALPFDITIIHPQIARTWFHAILPEEAARYSLLSCVLSKQFQHSGQALIQRQSLVFQTRTLSLLRRCVNAGGPVTEGMLVAAAMHFLATTTDLACAPEMLKTLRGINAMVDSRGGFTSLDTSAGFMTKIVLSACDATSALYNGIGMLFEQVGHPPKPQSFDLMYRTPRRSPNLVSHCGPDVLYVLECLAIVLFFRTPSQQARSLQSTESWYLVLLFRHVNCQLAILQARHLGSHSFSEIVTLTMILSKFQVLPESLNPQAIVSTILVRLQSAITSADHAEKANSPSVLMWVCTIASIGQGIEDGRQWFFDLLLSTLCERYDEEDSAWPLEWEQSLLNELRQYLWHVTMDESFSVICHKLRARREQGQHMEL